MTNDPSAPGHQFAGSHAMECLEIYIPKNLEHLSELYNYLRRKLTERTQGQLSATTIDGFSLYEVDGAFAGGRIYQERTLVIRILFKRESHDDHSAIQSRIEAIGREIATTVVLGQEEIWICHYPQTALIYKAIATNSVEI
ncbi:hypothetical protein [Planctomicrobium sp. SH664]|uniref:hypothetical protein n=1 Tax=Planctomicrobium sp. SH664 TaxID=3448125 RepID=UPI003F5B6D45